MATTVVGRVDSMREAESVARDLTSHCHCDRNDISLTTPSARPRVRARGGSGVIAGGMKGLVGGAILGAIVGFIVGIASIPVPGFAAVIARGTSSTIIMGAFIFSVIGVVIGMMTGMERHKGEELDEGVERPTGPMVTVHANDDQEADCVINVMRRHGAREIDKRSSDWSKRDWGDPVAEPDSPVLRGVPDRHAVTEPNLRAYNRPMEEADSAAAYVYAAAPSTEGWITKTYTATYFGPERRRAANHAPYQGAERRHSA
jgi:hypothetical protein